MMREKLNLWKRFHHSFLAGICWAIYILSLFFVTWHGLEVYSGAIIILGIELFLLLSVTISWVFHRLRLHRKFGHRTNVLHTEWDYKVDWLGYKVKADFIELKKSKIITITCDDSKKIKRYSV